MKRIFSLLGKTVFFEIRTPIIALAGLVVLSSLGTIYFLTRNPEAAGLIKGPEIIRREEDELISEVRGIIELPDDERPTVATVSEPDKLSDQQFFSKAQVGDKILVYNNAGKAVLYRPSENRVVELGNLNITQNQGQSDGEVASETDEAEEDEEQEELQEEEETPSPVPTPTPEPDDEEIEEES